MKQTKAIITTLLLFLANCSALPVTSKALENNSDQLIWQTAWYSDARASPFTGEAKKISPKSIFITPNLDQSPVSCPPGFKIDDNGKCIKIVSINQDDLLVTRLQSFFSQHQTTDDSTSIDYDYSVDEEATQFKLPLIPIFNETRGDEEQGESFRDRNDTQASVSDVVDTTTIPPTNYLIGTESYSAADENSNKTRVNESDINSDRNDTTTVDESVVDTTTLFTDRYEDESNYTTTTSGELVIKDSENPQPDVTISGDYFDAILQNDSLLIDETFSEHTTGTEFDVTTLGNLDEELSGEKGSGEVENEDKALADTINKMKATSENLQVSTEKNQNQLSSHEKASMELLSSEKASDKLSSSGKLSSYENPSTELLNTQKDTSKVSKDELSSSQSELSHIEKAPHISFTAQKASNGAAHSQKASNGALSSLNAPNGAFVSSQTHKNSQKAPSRIFVTKKAPFASSSQSKAPSEALSTQKASFEASSSQKDSHIILNSQKEPLIGSNLSQNLQKTSEQLSSSQKISTESSGSEINSPEFPKLHRTSPGTFTLQRPSQEFSKPKESFQKLSQSQNELFEAPSTEKASEKLENKFVASTEASQLSSKAPLDFLNKVPASLFNKAQEELSTYPKFVTVEKTSSKPSIVNGPFLIFGQPLMRPSSFEKVKIKEKISPENSFDENLSSSNPSSIENFEYSTFESVDGSFNPSNIDDFIPSTVENFKEGFESSTIKTKNKIETTTTPTTTQNFEFTPSFPYENRIIKDDQQNSELESVEEANKFVYHHLPSADASTTPIVRFPSQQRVRFPDEPSRSSSFSWPRDNGLMRFWQEQPLINDFKIFSRGHSNFRRPSYRRIQ